MGSRTFVVLNGEVGATGCFRGQRERELVPAVGVVSVNRPEGLDQLKPNQEAIVRFCQPGVFLTVLQEIV